MIANLKDKLVSNLEHTLRPCLAGISDHHDPRNIVAPQVWHLMWEHIIPEIKQHVVIVTKN